MPKINIPVLNYEQLVAMANPRSAQIPEAVPWWFYDTQTYTDNSTTQLTFFAATTGNRDLSNLESGGQIPDPNFFAIHYFNADFMSNAAGTPYATTGAGGIAGALDDVGRLLLSGRARFTLTISDKRYGPWPLSVTGGTGAAVGNGWGTFTAEESIQTGYNALHGGAYIGGKIMIPPKVGFSVVIDWPAAVDLTADYRVRLSMYGVYYRRIL